ncbi:hypothetical protein B0H63DRAFT_140955 [Podospora didyma]|uniref:Uncharacterized protein n=1 Tax=Podospora didyma TaxID=330526 RepID=A0AAE0U164_9PEZI|nr:hypothetical protein B0H63DRAFT_140955 [Podospora didyma]
MYILVFTPPTISPSFVKQLIVRMHQLSRPVQNQHPARTLYLLSAGATNAFPTNVTIPDRLILVEADVTSDSGIRGVVGRVRAGELPAFQHVYACVGGDYVQTAPKNITTAQLRDNMNRVFEANLFAYIATIPCLLSQSPAQTTFTLCTGSQGDMAIFPVPALTAVVNWRRPRAGRPTRPRSGATKCT